MAEAWRNRLGKAYSHAVLSVNADDVVTMYCGEIATDGSLTEQETAPKRCGSCQVAIGVERLGDD